MTAVDTDSDLVEAAAGGHNINITVNTQLQDTLLPSVNMNMVMRMVHGSQTPTSSSIAPVYTLRMLLLLQSASLCLLYPYLNLHMVSLGLTTHQVTSIIVMIVPI